MPRSTTCKVCGAVIPQRFPPYLLTWLVAISAVLLVLLIPTLVGFATVTGGIAIFLGIVAGVVALYLFLRAETTCQECRLKEK